MKAKSLTSIMILLTMMLGAFGIMEMSRKNGFASIDPFEYCSDCHIGGNATDGTTNHP